MTDKRSVESTAAMISAVVQARKPDVRERAATVLVLGRMAELAGQGRTSDQVIEEAVAFKTELEKGYKQGRGPWGVDFDDTVRDLMRTVNIAADVALVTGFGTPGGAFTKTVLDGMKSFLDLTPVQDRVTTSRAIYGVTSGAQMIDEYQRAGEAHIEHFYGTCLQDEACARAAAAIYPELAEPGTGQVDVRPAAVVRNHPDVFSPLSGAIEIVNEVEVSIDLDALKTGIDSQLATVNENTAAIASELGAMRQEQRSILAWIGDVRAREKAEANAKAARERSKEIWAAAGSAVAVAAVVAGLFDPKLGKDISRVGNAALTVGRSVMALADAAIALSKGVTLVTTLGTAAATGNVIGAVIGLIGAFGSPGPTPDQLILEGIEDLKKQLQTVQQQLNERFDHLERTLAKVYEGVLVELQDVQMILGDISGRLDDIVFALDTQAASLLRIESTVVESFKVAGRTRLIEAIDAGLGRPVRSGTPTMTNDEFLAFEGTFFTWATKTSGNDIEVPIDSRPSSDRDLRVQLRGPAIENVAYLNKVVVERGWPAFGPVDPAGRLHNLYTWSIAAASYSQLESEWPALSHAANDKQPDARRAAVRAPGQEVLEALRKIPSTGATGRTSLLTEAVAFVRQKSTAYGAQLDQAERAWRTTTARAVLGLRPQDPDLPVWRTDPHADNGYLPDVRIVGEGALHSRAVARIPAVYRNNTWLTPAARKAAMLSAQVTDRTVITPARTEIDIGPRGKPIRFHIPAEIDYTVTIFYHGQPIQRYVVRDASNRGVGRFIETGNANGPHDIPLTDPAVLDADRRLAWQTLATTSLAPELIVRQASLTTGDALAVAASELDGAVRLLDCLLELGLPSARSNDELVRAAFDGAPAWAGGIRVFTSGELLTAILDTAGADSVLEDIRNKTVSAFLTDVFDVPLSLLADRIAQYQQALDRAEYQEFYRLAEITLEQVRLAGAVVALSAREMVDRDQMSRMLLT